MNLFDNPTDQNLLPQDGQVIYFGVIFDTNQSKEYFDKLLTNIIWQKDELVIFGKKIVTERKMAWYGDSGQTYTYSGITRKPLKWTKELLEIKQIVEKHTKAQFNSCLLNLYQDGTQGMGWHSDDEKELGKNSTIASVSFGESREFRFRHKNLKNLKISVLLEGGSLLVMKDEVQQNWLHQIPKSIKITNPRINLTFRKILT